MSNPSQTTGYSAELALYTSAIDLSSVPQIATDESFRILVAVLVSAMMAWDHPIVDSVYGVVTVLGSPRRATLIGRGIKVGAAYAAMINATGARAKSTSFVDDPVALVVVPAALAAAELVDASLERLLTGVLAGLASGHQLFRALGKNHLERGWDPLGTIGRISAGLAVSRILELSYDHTLNAIGYTSTQAAGFVHSRDSVLAPIIAGKAAADGVEGALLAKAGLLGPPSPLEGRRGLFALEARGLDRSTIDLSSLRNGLIELNEKDVAFGAARSCVNSQDLENFKAQSRSNRDALTLEAFLNQIHQRVSPSSGSSGSNLGN